MPKIIGTSQVVVDDGAGLTIKELVGNVASNDDRISIAHVKVSQPASEPWLTLHLGTSSIWMRHRTMNGTAMVMAVGGQMQRLSL